MSSNWWCGFWAIHFLTKPPGWGFRDMRKKKLLEAMYSFCRRTSMRSKFKEVTLPRRQEKGIPELQNEKWGCSSSYCTGHTTSLIVQLRQTCPVPMFLLTFLRSHILFCILPRLPKPIFPSLCVTAQVLLYLELHISREKKKETSG